MGWIAVPKEQDNNSIGVFSPPFFPKYISCVVLNIVFGQSSGRPWSMDRSIHCAVQGDAHKFGFNRDARKDAQKKRRGFYGFRPQLRRFIIQKR